MAEGSAVERLCDDSESLNVSSGSDEVEAVDSKKTLPACKLRRNYYCKACAFCTINPREYLYHLRDEHGERLQIYECSDCVYASRGKVKLARHLRMVHGIWDYPFEKTGSVTSKPVASPVGKASGNKSAKMDAKKDGQNCKPLLNDDDEMAESPDGDENDDDHSNAGDEELHKDIASEMEENAEMEVPHDNEHETFENSNDKASQNGRSVGLKKKFYRCSKCDYTTHIRSRYSKHVRYHSMPMIKCELCEFQTPYKWNLDRHMKNHNDDGVYKCSVCKFSSQIKQSLTVHIQNHHLPHEKAGIEYSGGFVDLIPAGIDCDSADEEDTKNFTSAERLNSSLLEKSEYLTGEKRSHCPSPRNVSLANLDDQFSENSIDIESESSKLHQSMSVLDSPIMTKNEDHLETNMERIAEEAAKAFLSADPGLSDSKGPLSVLDQLFSRKIQLALSSEKSTAAGNVSSPSKPIKEQPIPSRSSSTRCQHCRHRCKSTDDLRSHLIKCPLAVNAKNIVSSVPPASDTSSLDTENVSVDDDDVEILDEFKSLCSSGNRGSSTVRKRVYSCPQCSFWSSTSSRFHMHLAGHMNLKPYECSACDYRSNWRWDITKHIKQKSVKDSGHNEAQLLVRDIDDTGKYDKYENFLVEMDIEKGVQHKSQEYSCKQSHGSSPARSTDAVCRGFVIPPNVTITPHHGSPGDGQCSSVSSDLPLPPPLTRAPSRPYDMSSSEIVEESSALNTNLETLKMDPALAAMDLTVNNTAIVMPEPPPDQRPTESCDIATKHESSTGKGGAKKATVWRCKKCNFKHPDREVVRSHYRAHLCSSATAADSSALLYVCGHCDHASLWRHVIERHCRSKHGGVVLVLEQPQSTAATSGGGQMNCSPSRTAPTLGADVSISVVSRSGSNQPGTRSALFRCDICSFVCVNKDDDISAHMRHHTPQTGAVFKCMSCPYYVSTQVELMEHMNLHGINQQRRRGGCIGDFSRYDAKPLPAGFYRVGPPVRQMRSHAFLCSQCPFSTNQRLLFVAHQQLHEPCEQRPLHCPCCSFGAQQRPQLAQHMRLHGVRMCNEREEGDDGDEGDSGMSPSVTGTLQLSSINKRTDSVEGGGVLLDDSETRHLAEIPLVWVSRAGKFYKMFKCRQCPHVNLRKSNIQEHERMHTDRDVNGFAHRCSHCNYVCVNAGVLSSHVKVHSYCLGAVHALVDPLKSDEQQLRAIIGDDQLMSSDCPAEEAAVQDSSSSSIAADEPISLVTAHRRTSSPSPVESAVSGGERLLYFCQHCPARFFHEREIDTHVRFHGLSLMFACEQCSYTSRQQQHLQSHSKVHSTEYAERSRSLLALYGVSSQYPPSTDLLLSAVARVNNSGELRVPVPPSSSYQDQQQHGVMTKTMSDRQTQPRSIPTTVGSVPRVSPKRHCCTQCPARFVKEATLRYHSSLHGCDAPFRCNKCNYAVKTYGNLTQHINLHIEAEAAAAESAESAASAVGGSEILLARPEDFPMSGLDLFKRKLDFENERRFQPILPLSSTSISSVDPACRSPARKQARFGPPPPIVPLKPGDPFYVERSGNPDFVYPTVTDRYGREREKRYKCRKCPSAFEKREQYLKHISLHGVSGRFTCTHCDYAVNYYPNFCNHMKRHGVPPLPMSEASNRVLHPVSKTDGGTETAGSTSSVLNSEPSAQNNANNTPDKTELNDNRVSSQLTTLCQ